MAQVVKARGAQSVWLEGRSAIITKNGESRVEKTVPFRYSVEPFDVGMDNVSAVSEEYKPPFPFKGRIEQVTIELK
jgi:hypothetical protein